MGSEEFVKEAEDVLRTQGPRLRTVVEETGNGVLDATGIRTALRVTTGSEKRL